jgi:hypothetical protein
VQTSARHYFYVSEPKLPRRGDFCAEAAEPLNGLFLAPFYSTHLTRQLRVRCPRNVVNATDKVYVSIRNIATRSSPVDYGRSP